MHTSILPNKRPQQIFCVSVVCYAFERLFAKQWNCPPETGNTHNNKNPGHKPQAVVDSGGDDVPTQQTERQKYRKSKITMRTSARLKSTRSNPFELNWPQSSFAHTHTHTLWMGVWVMWVCVCVEMLWHHNCWHCGAWELSTTRMCSRMWGCAIDGRTDGCRGSGVSAQSPLLATCANCWQVFGVFFLCVCVCWLFVGGPKLLWLLWWASTLMSRFLYVVCAVWFGRLSR